MKAASRLFANMYMAKEGCENMALGVTTGLAGGLSGLPNEGAKLLFLSGLTVRRTKLKLVGRAGCNEISVGISFEYSNTPRLSFMDSRVSLRSTGRRTW